VANVANAPPSFILGLLVNSQLQMEAAAASLFAKGKKDEKRRRHRCRIPDDSRAADRAAQRGFGPRISSHHIVGNLFAGFEGRGIHEHRGRTGKAATEELGHALIVSNQIDYLGGMPVAYPKPVRTSEKAKEMRRFDPENETETIRNYRQRIHQCEELEEYAIAEHISATA
jgi:hypothetical protein